LHVGHAPYGDVTSSCVQSGCPLSGSERAAASASGYAPCSMV
jgi:hypothetical protein